LTKSHSQISRGKYKCSDCDERNNICLLHDREFEYFLAKIKNFALSFNKK